MSTQEREELHLKYRPLSFDEYFGGDANKAAILDCLSRTRVFAFYGPRGCGKTTLARLIANKLGIHPSDIHEIDAADKTGVDDARAIKMSASYAPKIGKFKIYILDEAHRLSQNAFDSLLKTLEAPPVHCYFILCSSEWGKVPVAIQSRCKAFEVKPLMKQESTELINWVCESEGITLQDEIKTAILENCGGIPREIVITIDMVRNLSVENALQVIRNSQTAPEIANLCKALLNKEKWDKIAPILKGLTAEPEEVRYAVLGWMNGVLMYKESAQAALIIMNFSESFIYSKKAGLTLACWGSTH